MVMSKTMESLASAFGMGNTHSVDCIDKLVILGLIVVFMKLFNKSFVSLTFF